MKGFYKNNVEYITNGNFYFKVFVDTDGNVKLDTESIAMGLGITNTNADGVITPNWKYLNKCLGSNLSRGDFINENQFYKLIVEADTPRANGVLYWITSEVLPSIKNNGYYMDNKFIDRMLNNPDLITELARHLKEEN